MYIEKEAKVKKQNQIKSTFFETVLDNIWEIGYNIKIIGRNNNMANQNYTDEIAQMTEHTLLFPTEKQ